MQGLKETKSGRVSSPVMVATLALPALGPLPVLAESLLLHYGPAILHFTTYHNTGTIYTRACPS